MSRSIAGEDEACAAGNDTPARSMLTGMLGVGIVPFVDRRRTRTERGPVQHGNPRPDYEDLVDLVRAEMADPSH